MEKINFSRFEETASMPSSNPKIADVVSAIYAELGEAKITQKTVVYMTDGNVSHVDGGSVINDWADFEVVFSDEGEVIVDSRLPYGEEGVVVPEEWQDTVFKTVFDFCMKYASGVYDWDEKTDRMFSAFGFNAEQSSHLKSLGASYETVWRNCDHWVIVTMWQDLEADGLFQPDLERKLMNKFLEVV